MCGAGDACAADGGGVSLLPENRRDSRLPLGRADIALLNDSTCVRRSMIVMCMHSIWMQ
jgi:hypothetical protein